MLKVRGGMREDAVGGELEERSEAGLYGSGRRWGKRLGKSGYPKVEYPASPSLAQPKEVTREDLG